MKKKRIELDVTVSFFGIGFSSSNYRCEEKWIALILGFLVIKWNIK